MKDTYYAVLGVSETATEAEIKAAYRNLLKKIHPDTVSTLSPELKRLAEDATKEITEAYLVISNPRNRRQYDRGLAASRRQPATAATALPTPRRRRSRPFHSPGHYPGYCDECGMPTDDAGHCPKCAPLQHYAGAMTLIIVASVAAALALFLKLALNLLK